MTAVNPGAKLVVTGGSGKAGRTVLADLAAHGYDILNIDLVKYTIPGVRFLKADLTDLGQTYEVMQGADAVVHLAAIPAPGILTEEATFRINMTSTYNVFQAAINLGLKRIVWASSETTMGLPFDREQPSYAPIDEEHVPLPQSSYALSKILGEEMARQMSRWSGIPIIGLRFSNILDTDDYQRFPDYWKDAKLRKWNLWGYVDARDVALSCRLALTADIQGADHFIIAAGDTVMPRPNRELMAEVFPTVPLREGVGDNETLLSIKKAERLLGYKPQHSWRQTLMK
jgi:nucleoside-diphosphate-sugar epimerase